MAQFLLKIAEQWGRAVVCLRPVKEHDCGATIMYMTDLFMIYRKLSNSQFKDLGGLESDDCFFINVL
jgi:hypothetical protein